MEKKVSALVLLLILLLVDEFVVQTEARTCYAKSKEFRGRCYLSPHVSNCRTICKKEKFIGGRCSRGICFCAKKCGSSISAPPPPQPPPTDGGEGGGEEGGKGGGNAGGGGGEGGEDASHH